MMFFRGCFPELGWEEALRGGVRGFSKPQAV